MKDYFWKKHLDEKHPLFGYDNLCWNARTVREGNYEKNFQESQQKKGNREKKFLHPLWEEVFSTMLEGIGVICGAGLPAGGAHTHTCSLF